MQDFSDEWPYLVPLTANTQYVEAHPLYLIKYIYIFSAIAFFDNSE